MKSLFRLVLLVCTVAPLSGCSGNAASDAPATPPATNRDQAMKTMPADIQAKVNAQQGKK